MTPLFRFENISKSFGATKALRGVTIDIFPGEIHCIIGENGAGKSTLGKVCGGFTRPDSGTFWHDGKKAPFYEHTEARKAGVAMVFQELSLASDLSIQENLFLGEKPTYNPLRLVRRSQEDSRSQKILRAVGLQGVSRHLPLGQLPPGQQQLIEIGKALDRDPRILVLDEPTAMLSLAERSHLHAIMRELRSRGTAIVFVTHHVSEVAELADRATLLRNGALVDTIVGRPTIDKIVEHLGGSMTKVKDAVRERGTRNVSTATRNGPNLLSFSLSKVGGGTAPLHVSPGEIVGLYGVVGCGSEWIASVVTGHAKKTPTLNLEFAGRPHVANTPVHARRSGIGHLANGRAANGILPTRSIRENLFLRPRSLGKRPSIVPTHGDPDQELSNLGVRYRSADDMITSLSGGNQQKVLVGRLLASDLRLLVLEEPTAGVDIAAKADIHHLLRKFASKGLGILLVSSDLEETVSLCDRIYTLFDRQCVKSYSSPTSDDMASISSDVVGATAA